MQLSKICLKYEIPLIYPEKLTYENGWLAGFFDADGCVTMDKTNGRLSITLTQKTREILEPLIDIVRRLTVFQLGLQWAQKSFLNCQLLAFFLAKLNYIYISSPKKPYLFQIKKLVRRYSGSENLAKSGTIPCLAITSLCFLLKAKLVRGIN
jgi:hypothetical protein